MLEATRAQNSYQKVLWIALTISLLVHIIFSLSKSDLWNLTNTASVKLFEKSEERVIKIRLRENLIKKQIVENTYTENKVKPKDPKFLSKSDQSYKKQTRAKRVGTFDTGRRAKSSAKKISKKKVQAKKKSPSLSDLAFNSTPVVKPVVQNTESSKGSDGKAVASSSDFLKDIELGETTQLNTAEFKHYGFFHRIKQRLEQYWGDSLREKAKELMAKGKRVPAGSINITALKVILDSNGHIVKVNIVGKSGISELDEAATQAFNRAGPFPNPPRDLIRNGVAEIEWGFVVN